MSIAPYPKHISITSRYPPDRIIGRMTADEYVDFERNSLEKHEFIEGEVIRMAGGSPEHNRISFDTGRTFAETLEKAKSDCELFGSDQKVYINHRLMYYPDIIVVCGEAQFDDKEMLRNPTIIVEVLSPTTAGFDRGEKFEKYQTLESLQHYILIEQDRISVTHFEKIAGNLWAIVGTHTTLTDTLTVKLGETQIHTELTAIYRRINFEQALENTEPDAS